MHTNHIHFLLTFLLAGHVVNVEPSLTYWVDKSCTDIEMFSMRWIRDAIILARTTRIRNENKDRDPAFQKSFETLFDIRQDVEEHFSLKYGQKSGTAFDIVDWVATQVGSLDGPVGQDESNLRFYCDFDPIDKTPNSTARYQLVPDRETDKRPNSQRTLGLNQEIFDQYNYMRRPLDNYGCSQPRPEPLYAQTLSQPYTASELQGFVYNYRTPPANLARMRSVISLCQPLFDERMDMARTWNDVDDDLTYDQLPQGMNDPLLLMLTTHIVGHEVKHALPMRLEDVAKPYSYYWNHIVRKTTEDALNNVNNHLFLDILAELERRKWKLKVEGMDAKKGLLIKDDSLE